MIETAYVMGFPPHHRFPPGTRRSPESPRLRGFFMLGTKNKSLLLGLLLTGQKFGWSPRNGVTTSAGEHESARHA